VFRRRPGDMEDAAPVHGNTTLEIAWTAAPLIIVLALGIYGAGQLLRINRAAAQPELVVDVVGVQWAWSFSYPEQGLTSSTLMLPVNQPALFRLQSVDVIHSFWVPEFRIKMDAIPGTINELRITPTQPGDYRALCSELCGTAHAYMTAPVMVVEPAEFEAWVAEQQELAGAAGAQAARGQQLAGQLGCLGCHTLDGNPSVGPTFKGLFGSERPLNDGATVTADEAYLVESILDPAAVMVDGFSPLMPQNFADRTTEEDVQALVEFIKSVQ
jgi:cytochrome c oxidase subunit II